MQVEDLQRLVTWQMPYGKYKGRLLADLPGHYLDWFAREGFPEGDLGRLLEIMYELDHNALRHLLDPLRR
ncbi:cytoplasmic protein [Oxalobacteraceae bacterium OM1]|nr:cytoplasmic protein [Oxalobacteraceae bacterium OM1]